MISSADTEKSAQSSTNNKQYISKNSEWTFDLIEKYNKEIAQLADGFQLDTYPNQIEVISSEQMLDAYASVGMPLMYNHWSFGKQFVAHQTRYEEGSMGLAYEIVINSNPCIAYLMEENSMTMQAMVIAHASYGHNSFFKGNYLFKAWTNADAIVDYLLFAKHYITRCEEKYGIDAVEEVLDACHALQNHGVNRYHRPIPLSAEQERQKGKERERYIQQSLNEIWNTIPKQNNPSLEKERRFPEEPEENILYFLEKNAPFLQEWQRELIRITRKISQYFYPQKQTKVMNEGWATFWHYTLIHELYKKGKVNDSFIMEFLHTHTNVITQPDYDHPGYSGINPYALGFNIFKDIKRICETPTGEDKQWFPDIAGSNWLKTLDYAMRNFKDESFIQQFLSPKVIRDMHLFMLEDNKNKPYMEVKAIHNEAGYRKVRNILAAQHNLGNIEPNIQVYSVDLRNDRSMTLRHYMHSGRKLESESTKNTLQYISKLWGFDVILESVDANDQQAARYKTSASSTVSAR